MQVLFASFLLFLGYAMIYVFANDLSIRMPSYLQSCALAAASDLDYMSFIVLVSCGAWYLSCTLP